MSKQKLQRLSGDPIQQRSDGSLEVPDRPIIAFVEGDGTGPDIWAAAVRVFDAAVEKAYGGARQIAWHEVLAGGKAHERVVSGCPTRRSRRSEPIWSASRDR